LPGLDIVAIKKLDEYTDLMASSAVADFSEAADALKGFREGRYQAAGVAAAREITKRRTAEAKKQIDDDKAKRETLDEAKDLKKEVVDKFDRNTAELRLLRSELARLREVQRRENTHKRAIMRPSR